MTENNDTDSGQRLRPNRNDPLHDQQLQRDVQAINEQTARAFGQLPPGGLPVQSKHKPQLARPTVSPVTPALPPSDEDTTMQWKSATAVAVLATGSTLAACGANDTQSPRADLSVTAVSDAPARVEMQPVEVVPATASQAEANPVATTVAPAPEPERGPAIPAAELRRQIVALLGSFQTLKDLERENVERQFGVRMQRDPEAADGYKYIATTTEGWTYWIDTSRIYGKGNPSTTYISLDNGVEPFTNQEATYCTLEFEPLAKELVAMGYEQGARTHKRGRNMMWGFGRDSSTEKVGFGVGVIIYTLPSGSGAPQTCIGGFRIGGGLLGE